MPKYLVEVDFPGAGSLQPEELRAVAGRVQRSLAQLPAQVQWQHSYLAADRVYVVYIADDEALVREQLARVGLTAGRVSHIGAVIDASTAEQPRNPWADELSRPAMTRPRAGEQGGAP